MTDHGDAAAPVATTPARLPRNVRLLATASLLNDIASEMVYPLVPQFLLTALGANRLQLGLMEGAADSAASVLKLVAGAWSDQARRRKAFVVGGYLLAAVARPAAGLVTTPAQMLCARVVDRVGKGLRTAPRDALIADSTPREIHGRAFGFHRAMDHLGAVVGPLLASLFLLWSPEGVRTLFLFTAIPGLAVVALLAWGLKEPPASAAPERPPRLSLRPFDGRFRRYLLALVVFTLGNSSDAFLLMRAGELGVSNPALPLVWAAFHVVKSLGNLAAGPAADRWGPRPLILTGWLVYAGVYLAMARASTATEFVAWFLAYGVFYALTEPAEKKLVSQLSPRGHEGLAFGWFQMAVGIATLPASLLFGGLYDLAGPWAAFGTGAGLAALAAALLATVPRPDPAGP